MSIVRSASEWTGFFNRCRLDAGVAAAWGPVFADTIKDTTFSRGVDDLMDFLPTIFHESGGLAKMKEDGKYRAKRIRELGMASAPGTRWRSLVDRADEIAGDEYKFFEACYGGRMGNGPEGSGDGARYPGRTPIGITGRSAYKLAGERSGQDLLVVPELAEEKHFALEFCIDWWEGRVPDALLGNEREIRKVVNGGYFGFAEVEAWAATVRREWR